MSFHNLVYHALSHLSPSWKMAGTGGYSYGGRSMGAGRQRQGNLGASYGSITFEQNGHNHEFTMGALTASAAIGGSALSPDIPRSFGVSPSFMPTFYGSRIGLGPNIRGDLTLDDFRGLCFGISFSASFCVGSDLTILTFGASEVAFMAALALTVGPHLIMGPGGFMMGMLTSPAWLLMKGCGFVIGSSFGLQGGISASIVRGHIF